MNNWLLICVKYICFPHAGPCPSAAAFFFNMCKGVFAPCMYLSILCVPAEVLFFLDQCLYIDMRKMNACQFYSAGIETQVRMIDITI